MTADNLIDTEDTVFGIHMRIKAIGWLRADGCNEEAIIFETIFYAYQTILPGPSGPYSQ